MTLSKIMWLAASLGLLSPASGTAQVTRLFAGVSGGATLGDLHDPPRDTKSRVGLTGGVFAGFRFSRNTVVNVGTNWVQKGGGDTRVEYLEIPLTLGGVALIQDGLYRSRFYTGLALGIRLGCSSTSVALPCSDAAQTEWVWPIGLLVGRWSRGAHFVALDIRYTQGLSDAFESAAMANRSWQFRLLAGRQIGGRPSR